MNRLKGVFVSPVQNAHEYRPRPEDSIVKRILENRAPDSHEGSLKVQFQSNHVETLPASYIADLENGPSALSLFHESRKGHSDASRDLSLGSDHDNSGSSRRDVPRQHFSAQLSQANSDSDDVDHSRISKRNLRRRLPRNEKLERAARARPRNKSFVRDTTDAPDQANDQSASGVRRSLRSSRAVRQQTGSTLDGDEQPVLPYSSDDNFDLLHSDVLPRTRKRRRISSRKTAEAQEYNGLKYQKPTRQSHRSTRHTNAMKEDLDSDDLYRARPDSPVPVPKAVGARETFQSLPAAHRFVLRHSRQCETCGRWGGGPLGNLVYCQGCTLSYHKTCLGPRGSRDHLVTKVADDNFVLQCRRCVNLAKHKDSTAPDQAICQVCREPGPSCHPFRERKTALQEEKEREQNDGHDPVTVVDQQLINNHKNVLFRCIHCWRNFHFHHLASRSDEMVVDVNMDEGELADRRFRQHAMDWMCLDCKNQIAKPSALVAWRPVDPDAYIAAVKIQDVREDDKEYLIKWEDKSYFQCVWMPGAWVWGVVPHTTRRAFVKKNDFNNLPTMNTEDAIPEDYLRIDIVFDVRFTSIVETRAEEVDKARIREVDQAFVKFKGLGYEDVVWEKAPGPQDGDHWTDFVTAYYNWVGGRYTHTPKSQALNLRLEKARSTEFTVLEKKKQPDKLIGGELMKYQMDGLNWLYYKWYSMGNAILADEMGLGKTIQVIAFLATLVQDHNCFPFLIVVPHSTCPNWRREIKQWAPFLRVVTYFGSAHARSLAYRYEMFPEGSKDLRCHVAVTSYDTASDDSCQKFFKSVPWQALFVDEGQRLKNDRSLLYGYLSVLNVPFRCLLTGTPLQNNARELFNLLQFLDDSFDAEALELEYATLTKDNVPQLHDLIRPFFLRRTKAQVLTFLPPLAQIILPVSMSSLQAKLSQSILSRNPELVRAIFDSTDRATRKGERANLNNILMQLRKCLCHPFVYSKQIEDRTIEAAVSHRSLVEASAKLQLLELLLPKLQERGHRVLIFSQFLDMLDIMEDFLDGLGMKHQRLDGQATSLQKQKRIDEFNTPDSPLFAFLLSTRAGGVGINLATADTVIILDPDFNPHVDIQALSRAHRIGQKKKVLVYQLMTRASAEEKIVQIGRTKMALDHVLIDQMDNDDIAGVDMESILRFGAADILEGKTQAIVYDEASIEKLLDRSQIEETRSGENNSAESQFSFARVWANDVESLNDSLGSDEEVEKAPDPSVWDRILRERERLAAEEAAMRQEVLGRGKRSRQRVDYGRSAAQPGDEPGHESDSDTDFQADQRSGDEERDEDNDNPEEQIGVNEVSELHAPTPHGNASTQRQQHGFRRAKIIWDPNAMNPAVPPPQTGLPTPEPLLHHGQVCGTWHQVGHCPLKLAGAEECNLCGLAHYGVARSCPHIRSETQVREMLEALKQSPESRELIDLARKYLQGVKGTLVQGKKRKAEKIMASEAQQQNRIPSQPVVEPTGNTQPVQQASTQAAPASSIPAKANLDKVKFFHGFHNHT